MKKLKGDDLQSKLINYKSVNYKEINRDLLSYSKDYTANNVLPSYLRHEIEK